MRKQIVPESFVAFFTVCGFFIGLIFSVISIDGAFDIIVFTILITFLFYMLIHISIMGFVDTKKVSGRAFKVAEFEIVNDKLMSDLQRKQDLAERLVADLQYEKEEIKKLEAKERKKKNARKSPKQNAA